MKMEPVGAMLLGSISQEAHLILAVPMISDEGRFDTGEGGEDPKRFPDNRRSSIKQVALGEIWSNAKRLGQKRSDPNQIDTGFIAENLHTTPGAGLKNAQPHREVSVKVVSAVGVGEVAAGE